MFTFIHCHYQLPSITFLLLFSGQGVKELLYKDFLLLGSLSSGLLQPGTSLLLYLPCTVTVTEMRTWPWDTVIDWRPEDSWLISYWAWTGHEVLNVLCKTLFCVSAVVSHYKAFRNSMEGCRGETFAIYAQVTQLNSNGLTTHLHFTSASSPQCSSCCVYETSHRPRLSQPDPHREAL